MQLIAAGSEAEMVACFLHGELSSDRFGATLRRAMTAAGVAEQVVADPDLSDHAANRARVELLGVTRGYRHNRDLFDADFPASTVAWSWAELTPPELARVRYVHYDYWDELSGGTRLAVDAAARITAGLTSFDVSNDRFHDAARALAMFPPLILVGTSPESLVCLEGNLRLTAMALAGFPGPVRCLVGIDAALGGWSH